ncbi:hypothetical protein GQ54DRAFT_315304 [Martensiomyces pterosporus]|nr:hypothetical protein GQ54DRAFT_315304 [Martensiomyces pterosporus]
MRLRVVLNFQARCNEQLAYVAARTFNKLWMHRSTRESLQPFQTFCCELLRSTQIAVPIVMLTLLYVRKFKQRFPGVHGGPGSEYRMFVVALMLASKYLEDNTFTTQTWSDVSHLPAKELTIMQREFLVALDHRLHVPEAEYNAWITQLQSIILIADMGSSGSGSDKQLYGAMLPMGMPSPSYPSIEVRSPVGGVAADFQVVPSPTTAQYHEIPQAELIPSPPAKRMRPSLPSSSATYPSYFVSHSGTSSRRNVGQIHVSAAGSGGVALALPPYTPPSAGAAFTRGEFTFRLPFGPQQMYTAASASVAASLPPAGMVAAASSSCAVAAARQHRPAVSSAFSQGDRLSLCGHHAADADGVIGMPAISAAASGAHHHQHHLQHGHQAGSTVPGFSSGGVFENRKASTVVVSSSGFMQQQQQPVPPAAAAAAALATQYQPLYYNVPSFGYGAGAAAAASFPIYTYGA